MRRRRRSDRRVSYKELQAWLWDFSARPLSQNESAEVGGAAAGKVGFKGTLHKTPGFIEAHPFGTVPAAFSPDGKTGIFESNSIMRAVARFGQSRFPLYGRDPYEASRVDSFLDASLVFARDAQIYLLALGGTVTAEIHARAREGFSVYLAEINQATSDWLRPALSNRAASIRRSSRAAKSRRTPAGLPMPYTLA